MKKDSDKIKATCKICGTEFKGRTTRSCYCSEECKAAAKREYMLSYVRSDSYKQAEKKRRLKRMDKTPDIKEQQADEYKTWYNDIKSIGVIALLLMWLGTVIGIFTGLVLSTWFHLFWN